MEILFITLSNIGDAIMTTPTLERLHQIYPDAVIDLVCDARSQILFEYCPYRGEIFLKQKKAGKKGLFKLIRKLRKNRYDLIVDLRTDGLAYLLKGKKRLTKWNRKPYGPHAVEDLISIIDPINPERSIPATTVWLDKAHLKEAELLLDQFYEKKLMAVGPGANWEPKIWKAENFATVANDIKDIIDGVVLVGGLSDQRYSEAVIEKLQIEYLDFTAKTDLLTAAAILGKCRLFLGNDSGLGHLASAVGTPTITVFGPGNAERYHPWHNLSRWVSNKNGDLNMIPPDEVIRQCYSIIKERGES